MTKAVRNANIIESTRNLSNHIQDEYDRLARLTANRNLDSDD